MFVRILLTVALFITSTGVYAAKADINLAQDSARFTYFSSIGGSNYGRTEMSAGLMFNKDKNSLWELGLQVVDAAGSKSPGLEIGIGPKLYFFKSDSNPDASGLVVAIGASFRYKFPQMQRLFMGGAIYYAPSITSTIDAENYMEFGLRAGYEILPTADVYVGIRNIRVDYTKGNGSHPLDETAMIGTTFSF